MPNPRHVRHATIVYLLQSSGYRSAGSLASHFGVSERTIYRDIVELVSYGIPIESVAGRTGGFRLAVTPTVGAPGAGAAGDPGAAAVPGTDRADRADRPDRSDRPDRPGRQGRAGAEVDLLERCLLVDPVDPTDPDPVGRTGRAATLRRAMRAGLAVELTWRPELGRSRVTVKPYGLVWRLGEWWLVGAVSGRAPGRLRLDDVAGVRVTDLRFDYPADSFDLRTWWVGSATGRDEGRRPLPPGRHNAGPRGRHSRIRSASQGSGS